MWARSEPRRGPILFFFYRLAREAGRRPVGRAALPGGNGGKRVLPPAAQVAEHLVGSEAAGNEDGAEQEQVSEQVNHWQAPPVSS